MRKQRLPRTSFTPRFIRVFVHCLSALSLLSGCATALTRESQCLAGLAAEVVQANEEIANLEVVWHESIMRRDVVFHGATRSSPGGPAPLIGVTSISRGHGLWEVSAKDQPGVEEVRLAAQRSHNRLLKAKTRYQPLFAMYDQVYQRVRTRTEEETILSNLRTIMLAGPASFLFYPIIRWNVRATLWDGLDPDAATDPIANFCASRQSAESVVSDSRGSGVSVRGESSASQGQPQGLSPRLVAGHVPGMAH